MLKKILVLFDIPLLPFLAIFLMLVSTTVVVSSQSLGFSQDKLVLKQVAPAPFPRLQKSAPEISAFSAVVFNPASSVVLFEKNSKARLLPASTTKIVTALVALEHFQLSDVLTVGKIDVEGQRMKLEEGERISVGDLLLGLLVSSANDAAEVLATSFPSGREAFVDQMNKKAQALNLKDTHFSNPTGIDEVGHFSTASDLARLGAQAIQNSLFAKMVSTQKAEVFSVDGKISHRLVNLNELLGEVSGVLGIKTGWTESSGEALVTLVERNGVELIIVVLGSSDRFTDTKKLINWAYSTFDWKIPHSP